MTMEDINKHDLDNCDSVSQANLLTDQNIKKETLDDEFQITVQEHYFNNRGVDVKEVIDSSLNEVVTAGKYSLQIQAKNEAEVDADYRGSSFKQETVKCDPEEIEVYPEHSIINSRNQSEIVSIDIKREPEEPDNSTGVERIRNVRLIKPACIKEYASQTKGDTLFDDIDRYNRNESEEESQDIYHQCNSCDYKIKEAEESSEKYQCQFCDCKYSYKPDLKRHMNYKHNEDTDWHHCNFCFYKTKKKRVLMIHLERHKANSEIYRCQFCEYTSKYKFNMNQHINYKHSAQWYQCHFCDHKTKHKSCLVKHFKANHDEHPEMYFCHACEYKSKDKSNLRRHINNKHTENGELYRCQFCKGKYKTKSILRTHVKYIHNENVKWYYCNECDYKTKYRRDLECHASAKHDENCREYKC